MYYVYRLVMSILGNFKKKLARSQPAVLKVDKEINDNQIIKLSVDVFQTEQSIVIFAEVCGVDLDDIQITIEGDADIVLIEGRRIRPEYLVSLESGSAGDYFVEECHWGEFYRRIILPESIIIEKTEAKIKNGVLLLTLPLLKSRTIEKLTSKAVAENKKQRVL